MKKTACLFWLTMVVSVLFISPAGSAPVYAQVTSPKLQMISPENIQSLQLLTSIGQGIYTGALTVQPGGDLIAAVAQSGIALVDRNSGQQTAFIPVGFQVTALSISPDGQTLAVVYNAPTGKMTGDATINGPEYQRHIGFYSLPDGQPKGDEITDLHKCGNSNIWQIAFLPDGESLIFEKKYGSRDDSKLFCVLSLTNGEIAKTMDIPAHAESSISPDGRFVAVVQFDQDDEARNAAIYAVPEFQPVADIPFSPVKFPEISFTHRGDFVLRFYEGETDISPHQVHFWSLPDGKLVLTLQEQEQYLLTSVAGEGQDTKFYDRIMSEDISQDGQWVVTGSQNGKVKLWDAQTGQMKKELGTLSWTSHNLVENPAGAQSSEINSYVNPVVFSADGKTLAAAENLTTFGQSGQIHLYQMPDGEETAVLKGETVGDESAGFAFSPDSSSLVYGGFSDGSAEVHNALDGALELTLSGHTSVVNQARFSPDGKWVATASDDKTIRLWNAENGKMVRIFNGHTARVNQIAFSPDGKWLVSAADDNTLRRWQVEDGRLLETRSLEGENWRVEFLSVLADQRSVVYTAMRYSSPLTGYEIRQMLWNVDSGEETSIGGGKITIQYLGQDDKTFIGYDDKGRVIGNLDSNGKMTLTADGIRSPYGNGALAGSTLSPDNRLFIAGNGFGLQAWKLTESTATFLSLAAGADEAPAYGDHYEISPDGKKLAFSNGGVIYLMGVLQD